MKEFFDLPRTPETATSTSPRPPGPFMKILSVFPEEWPRDRRLPKPVLPAGKLKETKKESNK